MDKIKISSLLQLLLKSLLSLGIISTLLCGDCRGDPQALCSLGQYFDTTSNSCTACSSCDKDNEVIKQICSGDRNTVCGPFYEFSVFLQKEESLSSSSSESVKHNASLGEDTWYILTLVLIGCFCITSILLVVLVIIAVLMYQRQKSQKQLWTHKEIHRNETLDALKDTDKMLLAYVSET